jgi:RNA polymerase sigma-70 factor (ECF subfamily)
MHTTPVSLLERLRQPGEQAAWARFVKLYTPLLCHWARRLGARGQDVADLVQDVFTVLVQTLPSFKHDPQKRFRGWLWTITRNKWREKGRRCRIHSQDAGDGALADLASPEADDGLSDADYRQYLVNRALELMKAEFQPTTWKAFLACIAGDRSAADVGAELGLSIDAVYAAKSRVLRRLRQELDGLMD